MFVRLVYESFRRQKRRKLLAGAAITLGVTVATAMIAVATGVRTTHPWWRVSGAWPDDSSRDVLIGERLASRIGVKPGDPITLSGRELRVSGILSTGSAEDDEIIGPIALAQEILGKPGAV